MSDPLVCSLDDPRAQDPALTGGKAATLARLRAGKYPVPSGFVVTTESYRAHADAAGVPDLLDALDGDAPEEAAAALRDRLAATPLPAAVADAIRGELDEGAYAVRSSATAEDLAAASFAGQHETELGVASEDVPAAVARCLASLFTDRAVAYRERNDVPHDAVEMAVVVQRMVEPDRSGVLFTADPVSGNRTVAVVDAGPGRGERQVSGRETADTARVDRDAGEVLDYRVGEGGERVLSDDDLRALVDLGGRVEAELGGPQDLEWAMRDGEVFLLQSRPVTSLYPVPEPLPDDDRLHVYYSFGHRQGMLAAMPPLSLDLWRSFTTDLGREYGLPGRFAVVAGGRLYLDLTAYLARPRLAKLVVSNLRTIDEPTAAALDRLLAARGDELPDPPSGPLAWARAGRSAGRFAWTLGGWFLTNLPSALRAPDPEAAAADLRAFYDGAVTESVATIRSHDSPRQRVRAAHDELFGCVDWLLEPFYGPFLAGVAAGWALRRLVPERAADVDALAGGFAGNVTTEMTLELGDVADVARDHPAVADALREGATLGDVRGRPGGRAFAREFEAFLDEYGFRAAGEIDPSQPRYREDPTLLLDVAAARLDAGERGEHRERMAARAADARAAADRLEAAAHPALRPVVRRLCRVYRNYVGLREHPKYALSKLLAEFRAQVLAAADFLAVRGVLADRADVWLLTLDELDAALADGSVPADLPARRRDLERFGRMAAPRLLTSEGEMPVAEREREPTDGLTGTGVSPGVVEGVVRVVTDPANAELRPGEVLVAPYTDPGWTPLFLNASALVTEVGGRLTHGSLVAREYGIPAVVAVEDATRRLETGDRVRVDGTNGVVERVA